MYSGQAACGTTMYVPTQTSYLPAFCDAQVTHLASHLWIGQGTFLREYWTPTICPRINYVYS